MALLSLVLLHSASQATSSAIDITSVCRSLLCAPMQRNSIVARYLLQASSPRNDNMQTPQPQAASAGDQALRNELLARKERDNKARAKLEQHLRSGATTLPADLDRAIADIDVENARWLQQVIEKRGWPGIALTGEDGSAAAWLLAQHADHDLPFQKRALNALQKAVAHSDALPLHVAYLTDRVAIAEGRLQTFGTQLKDGPNGPEPFPIEDPLRVDERRKAVGLKPLAESLRRR